MRRYLRGAAVNRSLQRLGIDPVRFWLLTDLFGELGERRELFTQLGRDSMTLRKAAWAYYIMSTLMAFVFVVARMSVSTYTIVFLVMSVFLYSAVLLSETSNSLVSPVEALVLAHQPINGATYTAAKLTHLLRLLLHLVPGLSLVPALASLLLTGCPWYYPPVFLAGEFALGVLVALSCCAIFGWLIRLVPPSRLKAAGIIAESAPWLLWVFSQFQRNLFSHIRLPAWAPQAAAALAAVFVILAIFGLRALSGDYLVRVAAIAHGHSRGSSGRRSIFGGLVARLCGGPAARAGFEYLSRMMRRDWQFRRQLLQVASMVLMSVFAAFRGLTTSPFSSKFGSMHIFPHVFGVLFFGICSVIVYGGDHRGSWLFLLAPAGAFRGFTRGIYAALCLFVVVPHAMVLPLLVHYWGVRDAALLLVYSLAFAAVYLGLELRLIEGMPFSKQPESAQNMMALPLILGGTIAIAIIVALQYFLIFRSPAAVVAVTVALAVIAWFLTRASLDSLEATIRFHLGILTRESKGLYQEVEA